MMAIALGHVSLDGISVELSTPVALALAGLLGAWVRALIEHRRATSRSKVLGDRRRQRLR
jgi:hypothetical protein